MITKKEYPLVKSRPVAKFFYTGHHTHPVRRTVLLIESTPTYIRGYEVREGRTARSYRTAPIKTYSRNRIAKIGNIDSRRVLRAKATLNEFENTTLTRTTVRELIRQGA